MGACRALSCCALSCRAVSCRAVPPLARDLSLVTGEQAWTLSARRVFRAKTGTSADGSRAYADRDSSSLMLMLVSIADLYDLYGLQ